MSEFVETPLGILPRSWQIKQLGETTTKIQDGTHFSPQTDEGPCLYLTSKNIKFGRFDIKDCGWISQQEHDSIYARCDVKYGDVLLTKDGANTGNACLNDLTEPFSLLSSVAFLRTDGVTNHSGFILQYLLSPLGQRRLKDLMSGNAIPRLTLQKIKAFKTPAPTSEEQRRIATILSTLDEVIEATEKLVEKHQQIKSGLMHDLFTRGLWTRPELARRGHKGTPAEASAKEGKLRPTPADAPGLYQDSPLGLIPNGWRVDSIGNVFEIQLGKMLNKLAKSGRYSAVYLGNRAVQWDRIDPSSLEEMDFSPSEREKFSLKPGDLLICEGGDVGRTAMWRGEIENCYYQKAIHRLRPKSPEVIPDFMLRFMRYAKDSGHFADFTSQSSIAHLTQEKLASIPMLIPPPEEQRQLVIRFEGMDNKIDQENTHLAKLRQQKQGLMHDLLTGRVRVDGLAQLEK